MDKNINEFIIANTEFIRQSEGKDNGAGFNMKYTDKLFGVFPHRQKARDFERIGIGLDNVNRIMAGIAQNVEAKVKLTMAQHFYLVYRIVNNR